MDERSSVEWQLFLTFEWIISELHIKRKNNDKDYVKARR